MTKTAVGKILEVRSASAAAGNHRSLATAANKLKRALRALAVSVCLSSPSLLLEIQQTRKRVVQALNSASNFKLDHEPQ